MALPADPGRLWKRPPLPRQSLGALVLSFLSGPERRRGSGPVRRAPAGTAGSGPVSSGALCRHCPGAAVRSPSRLRQSAITGSAPLRCEPQRPPLSPRRGRKEPSAPAALCLFGAARAPWLPTSNPRATRWGWPPTPGAALRHPPDGVAGLAGRARWSSD